LIFSVSPALSFPSQLETQQYKPALALIDTLLTELKRLDDKMILTEVHLLESRVYRGIGNMAKAKVRHLCLSRSLSQIINLFHPLRQAALTSSRTAANSIYCPPILQASLDLQSGILHAEDKDYTTAYSYFFEAFENLSAQGVDGIEGKVGLASGGEAQDGKAKEGALGALKYMLLCKVMLNLVCPSFASYLPSLRSNPVFPLQQPEDVNSLLTIKLALKYANMRDVESMRAIARAHQGRNLADFEKALRDYRNGNRTLPHCPSTLPFAILPFLFSLSSSLPTSNRLLPQNSPPTQRSARI
jgi:26S proteasome regulatory subunit N6